jgi:Hint domain
MLKLNLIDTSFIERWETSESDDAPESLTRLEIRPDARIASISLKTEDSQLGPGSTGTILHPLRLAEKCLDAGSRFRVSSVFTSDNETSIYALTDEVSIFALAFSGDGLPTGRPVVLRKPEHPPAQTEVMDGKSLICFTPGTLLLTESGPRPVESIVPGDRVRTRDRGLQEVRWRGETMIDAEALEAAPALRPVVLRKNSIAVGVPARDVAVSPNHHILVNHWRADLLFGDKEVLASAGDMANARSIYRPKHPEDVRYIHLLFVRHEIVFANGMEMASYLPDSRTLAALSDASRDELFRVFPRLRSEPDASIGPAARRLLKPAEVRLVSEKIVS